MSTMYISLPDSLKSFVDEQVASPGTAVADGAYFDGLRNRARQAQAK